MNPRRCLARSLLAGWFLVASSLLCGPAWAAFTASADRTQLAAGDSVQLTLQSDRSGSSEPDLAPLKKDFDILGQSTSNSLQIINGSMSSQRQVRLVLAPRRSGLVEVPQLKWDGESSAAIALNVAANGAGPGGTGASGVIAGPSENAAAHVFLTTSLDSLQPYVQSAVSLKVQLYSDKKLYQASLDLPGNADLLVRRLGEDVTTQETRNGRPYQVITRHYLLVPQRSGEIQLDGPVLNAQVADVNKGQVDPILERLFGQLQIEGGLNGTRPLRLRGDPLKLVAQPRPPAGRSGDWLPAQQLTLDEAWGPADQVIAVGEPLTRHLRLAAVGQSASQLPDLSALTTVPPGLKAHAEEAKLSDELQDGHVVGQREQDITLLADQPGRYQLPELRLAWWDVVSNQRREAVLPAVTVEVVAAANAASAGTSGAAVPPAEVQAVASAAPAASSALSSADEPAASSPSGSRSVDWVWVSAAFALLWLGTLGAWAWVHRRRHRAGGGDPAQPAAPVPAVLATQARVAFQQACRSHAARGARDALIAWARATWPQGPPVGLNALARRLGNPALTALLRELDRACITGTAWNGDALARALPTLDSGGAPAKKAQELPNLYIDPQR
jgi:hypothetical protein